MRVRWRSAKVDFALVHINRFDANFHAIAQAISLAAGFPHQALPYLVKAIVSLSSEETWTRPSMNKSSDGRRAKASDAGNYAFKDVTYLVEHEVTLQPVSHIARCFVGTSSAIEQC